MAAYFDNNVIQPLLIDLYEITMAYAYWKDGKMNEKAVFEVFFRKNPFQGAFTVFAGLKDCLLYMEKFRFSEQDIKYLKTQLPQSVEPEFYEYLGSLDTKDVTIYAIPEGTVVFPKLPLLTIEGPLAIVQMLESSFLNLINFASLITTNAARYRIAASDKVKLYEFGMRRAQGPDGGLSASKYAYLGGFDATSNLLAGKLHGIPVAGTHAHLFVLVYHSLSQLKNRYIKHAETGKEADLVSISSGWRKDISPLFKFSETGANEGEFASFLSYALAFPDAFLVLVDTYDVMRSGLLNFAAVALSLEQMGYRALGIRIDSGDLAYLSKVSQETFSRIAEYFKVPWFNKLAIMVGNEINEDIIYSLNEQDHKITAFGIGAHLVTCQKQPALGCVYKLMEQNGSLCIKLSEDLEKITIPGRKKAYRFYSADGYAICDLLTKNEESSPEEDVRKLVRHPLLETKRAYVTPSKVVCLQQQWWGEGKLTKQMPSLFEVRAKIEEEIKWLRPDMKRYLNPTPYKVSVTENLYDEMHLIWKEKAPVVDLR